MSEPMRERAEARLLEAFAREGIGDNRPAYRQRLRTLRERNPDAFARALSHYEDAVVPALAGDADPVATWIEYGRWLAELDGSGRMVEVDAGGRAAAYDGAPGDALVLFVPDDAGSAVLPARLPAAPSRAQRATYDLLVAGKLELAS